MKRWIFPEARPSETAALASALGLSHPIAAILVSRGIANPSAARTFLAPQLDDLHDPALMRDMPAAIERISRAIRDRERIQIHGDYDVDGATSTVILKIAIEMAGGTASYRIPNRLTDGYGLQIAAIERAAAEGVSLIVSVDTGIRAGAAIRRAAELGIDVVVTDHHLPDAELPAAFAILNPNRPGCAYPEKNLCGVGVVFKLVQGLLATLNWPAEKLRRVLESFLKLVAIGTVADVVPLTGENRLIVKHGLAGLRAIRNPGLRALLDVAGFTGQNIPSATQVAFRIAPRINAAGRMASADEVVEMFTTADPERARELAGKLHLLNADRQGEEARITELVLEECTRMAVDDTHAALVFCAEKWHRGVLGIVASRLVERFHRPVFVLSEEDGFAQGSGRSIAQFHLLAALEAMPHLFVKFGGHSHAAGLTLASGQVAPFRERLNEYAGERLRAEDFQPTLNIDSCVRLTDLDDRLFHGLQRLAPFGAGNPAPVFAACEAEVSGPISFMKERHVRVPLRQGGKVVQFKGFHFAGRAAELAPGTHIDAAFCLEHDSYGGSWSAILKDLRPT
ncbi:MAG: single-stranded-DNA-specific exonuclease RecJ [Acidobacteriota bacterium]|nr:single-stranded-DNA-specific exonuclease RecJ [Acidobacteriota bacterium]